MRSLLSTFLFAAILAAGCGRSGSPVASDVAGGQKIAKDSSSDGSGLTRTGIGYSPDPGSSYNSVHDGEKAQATFSGGDGSSIKNAVVINASGEEPGIRAAYIWSHEHYPHSRLLHEGVDNDGDRFYFEMNIVTSEGKPHTNFFEITSCFGQ
jgi:hypothetical protein